MTKNQNSTNKQKFMDTKTGITIPCHWNKGVIDQILENDNPPNDERLRLGVGEDMFQWKYKDYTLDIGFYGHNHTILKIMLIRCDDWDDHEKAAVAWWKPVKTVVCKSKEDVTKTVVEMIAYVKRKTQKV